MQKRNHAIDTLCNEPTVHEFSAKTGLKVTYVLAQIRRGLIPIVYLGEKPIRPYRIATASIQVEARTAIGPSSLKIRKNAQIQKSSKLSKPTFKWALG